MFYSHESDNHLFEDELRALAVIRDVDFFRTLMNEVAE